MEHQALSETLQETLARFSPGTPLTTPEVADALDLGRRTTYTRLDKLVEAGVLETKKVGANARVWWRPVADESPVESADERDGTASGLDGNEEFERLVERQAVRFERQRDELESELDEVFERISDGFYALDEEFRFLYLNDHAKDVLGLDESAVGQNLLDIVSTTDEFEQALYEARDTQEPVVFEDYYDPINRWFHNALYPSETGISVYFREITDQKRREQEIERSRALLRHTEQLAEVGGWETDLETGEQRWTQGLFNMHDFDVDEADQQRVPTMEEYLSFVAPEHREPLRRAVDRSVTAAEPFDEEIRITTKEGRDRWIRTFGVPVFDDDELVALRGAARDITADRERERRLSTLINNVPGMVYRCRNERGWPMEFVSDACTELTGYGPDPLESGEIEWGEDVIVDEDRDLVWGSVQREITDGNSFSETYGIETADGDIRWVKDFGRGVVNTTGNVGTIEGIIQDVTEQVEYERELEQYEQIVETVADGIYVLDEDRRFTMMNDGFTSMTGYDREELLGTRAETVFGEQFVEVADEKQAALESGERDVAVLEEELYRADGTVLAVESRFDLFESPDGQTGRVGVVRDVSDRVAREQELQALNSINEVSNEITDAIIEKSTREEIESAVCECFADSESYLFAWVGDVDSATQTVNLRTEAGVEGYLDGITISVDPDDERSQGPTGRALLTGKMQTTHDVQAESQHDPWRGHIESYGFRSSAAIPIVHGESVYGVLNVYAERSYAFEGREGELIARIGEVVGHAIAATERKRTLMSDEVVELDFQIQDLFEMLDVNPIHEQITLDYAVPRGDDEFLLYGTAAPGAIETVTELVDALPYWDAVTVLSEGETVSFELQLTEPPVLSVVAELGGYIDSLLIQNGDMSMSIHLSPSVDARRINDAVETAYPTAQMVRRRQVSRAETGPNHVTKQVLTDLTDRQRAVLDAAYHAGYFEWPRVTDGTEVAESLGIAPSTFSHHLRKAQRKVLDTLYTAPDQARS